jgi:osomolarity two-component system sensor histidine kinase NIK1
VRGSANRPGVNVGMCSSLTDQVRSIGYVATAIANGDLSQKVEIEAAGEIAILKDTVSLVIATSPLHVHETHTSTPLQVNNMVAQLTVFAREVSRVALEVGTKGILGGSAQVEGVGGVWLELTTNVNQMAQNLTEQCVGIPWSMP